MLLTVSGQQFLGLLLYVKTGGGDEVAVNPICSSRSSFFEHGGSYGIQGMSVDSLCMRAGVCVSFLGTPMSPDEGVQKVFDNYQQNTTTTAFQPGRYAN